MEDVTLVARLAKGCLHLMGIMRPTMKEAVTKLEIIRASMYTIDKDEYEGATIFEDASEKMTYFETSPTMILDTGYTWTSSNKSASEETLFL